MKVLIYTIVFSLSLSFSQPKTAKAEVLTGIIAGTITVIVAGGVVLLGKGRKAREEGYDLHTDLLMCAAREMGPEAFVNETEAYGDHDNEDAYPSSILWNFYNGDNPYNLHNKYTSVEQTAVINIFKSLVAMRNDIGVHGAPFNTCGFHRPKTLGYHGSCEISEEEFNALSDPCSEYKERVKEIKEFYLTEQDKRAYIRAIKKLF